MNTTLYFISRVDSSSIILTIFYYIGIMACIASGYEKGKSDYHFPLLHMLLNCYAGGLLRDLFLLNTEIWFFSRKAIPELLVAIILSLAYSLIIKQIENTPKMSFAKIVISFLDILGLGSFISLGGDKALSLGFSKEIAIFSSYFTCCCGGLVANYNHPYAISSKSNLYYQAIAFLGCILYIYIPNGILICCFIGIFLLIPEININMFSAYYSTMQKLAVSKMTYEFFPKSSVLRRYKNSYYHSRSLCCAYPNKAFIIFHRIRLC